MCTSIHRNSSVSFRSRVVGTNVWQVVIFISCHVILVCSVQPSVKIMVTFRRHHRTVLDMHGTSINDLLSLRVERSAVMRVKPEQLCSVLAVMVSSTDSHTPRIVIGTLLVSG